MIWTKLRDLWWLPFGASKKTLQWDLLWRRLYMLMLEGIVQVSVPPSPFPFKISPNIIKWGSTFPTFFSALSRAFWFAPSLFESLLTLCWWFCLGFMLISGGSYPPFPIASVVFLFFPHLLFLSLSQNSNLGSLPTRLEFTQPLPLYCVILFRSMAPCWHLSWFWNLLKAILSLIDRWRLYTSSQDISSSSYVLCSWC